MKISAQIARSFNKAVTNVENIDATLEDGINWNYVDADIHMDLGIQYIDSWSASVSGYTDQFNYLADCFAGRKTVHQVRQDRFQVIPVTNPDLILDPSKPAYMVKVA